MVEEKYCSFEIAKLLKEKKFDIPSLRWYNKDGDVVAKFTTSKTPLDYFRDEYYYLCPTHQMALAWLREEKKVFISISAYSGDHYNGYIDAFEVNIYQYATTTIVPEEIRVQTNYDVAIESALKFALEELI